MITSEARFDQSFSEKKSIVWYYESYRVSDKVDGRSSEGRGSLDTGTGPVRVGNIGEGLCPVVDVDWLK